MDELIEVLKYLSGAMIVFAPLLKLFFGRRISYSKRLEERYDRLKRFFDEGGVDRHPLLMEACFAAAVGHSKLNAIEIPLVLRQKRPTHFIDTYIRVKDYLAPTSDGSRFELRSIASQHRIRAALVLIGATTYVVFLLVSIWLLFYVAPKLVVAMAWNAFLGVLSMAIFFIAVGVYCLAGAGHLHWAKKLASSQNAT